ncbi:MAG: aminopeptidase, partial [Clostridia bacterium]|nr:aminopeptidase [Clostridia bacterium]
MKKSILQKYANLLAVKGVNVQKGQDVLVVASLDQPEFVAMVTEALYKAGARKVYIDWDYQPLGKLHVKYQSIKTLSTVDRLALEKIKWRSEDLPAHLYLVSDDSDGLKGINIDKMVKAQQAKMKIIKPYRDAMESKYQWCIAAVPG